MKQTRKLTDLYSSNYLLEVLRGKKIELIHIASDFFKCDELAFCTSKD